MNLDFNAKRGFICDMDGVIYHGNRVLPGWRNLSSGSTTRRRSFCS